jgi:antitoxin component YwqK of YwqJK toxin-antitoxin module
MATDIMVPRVVGVNSFWVVILVIFYGCRAHEKNKVCYTNTQVQITYKGEKTLVNGEPVDGCIASFYANGDTASVIPYSDGKEDGILRYYYPGGKLKAVRLYKSGKKQGHHQGWYQNGQPMFAYDFFNDLFDGENKEWYANGQPFKFLHFTKGVEQGVQQIWYPDGSIKSNYLIQNNRKYGLLGSKNCTNVADSLFK